MDTIDISGFGIEMYQTTPKLSNIGIDLNQTSPQISNIGIDLNQTSPRVNTQVALEVADAGSLILIL